MILGINLTDIALDGVLGDKLREEFPGITLITKTSPTPLQVFENFKSTADRWCDFEGDFTDPEHMAAAAVAQMLDIHWELVEKLVVLYRQGELDVDHPLINMFDEKVDFEGLSIRCLIKGPGARPVWQRLE